MPVGDRMGEVTCGGLSTRWDRMVRPGVPTGLGPELLPSHPRPSEASPSLRWAGRAGMSGGLHHPHPQPPPPPRPRTMQCREGRVRSPGGWSRRPGPEAKTGRGSEDLGDRWRWRELCPDCREPHERPRHLAPLGTRPSGPALPSKKGVRPSARASAAERGAEAKTRRGLFQYSFGACSLGTEG